MRFATRRSNVDLPHPDGPIRLTNSPGATVRSMSVRATTSRVVARVEHVADVGDDDRGRWDLVHAVSTFGRLRIIKPSKTDTIPAITRPSAAAPKIAVNSFVGSPVDCWA